MKKFVLTICVVIICMVTALFYGKTGIKQLQGFMILILLYQKIQLWKFSIQEGRKLLTLTMKVITHWMIWKRFFFNSSYNCNKFS